MRHYTSTSDWFITQVIFGSKRNVELRNRTRTTLGTLKLIRENKVGESAYPETKPFKNMFPKKCLRSAKGIKPRKKAT